VTALVQYNSRSDIGNLKYLSPSERDAIEIISGNVINQYFIMNLIKGKDIVFHLAALIGIPYSYVAPLDYVSTNIEGTVNILEACRSHSVSKMVHTSTSEVYGSAIYTPIDEKHPLQGQSPYSASKISADKLVESYHLSFNIPVTTIRPFNTFGPRQSQRAVIPTIVAQALYSEKIMLGDMDTIRDFNYVKNTVLGFLAIAESEKSIGETINVGYGKGIAIGNLVETIFEILGDKKEIVQDQSRVRPEKSEVRELICNNQKAKDIMDWGPKYSLKEGLQEVIEFHREVKADDPERYIV
jgi:NAD dependent epimerase/dehydratase